MSIAYMLNNLLSKAYLYAAFLIGLHPEIVQAQHRTTATSNVPCGNVIHTKIVAGLSVDEISKLGDGISIENNFGGLILRPFDEDDRPRRGKEVEVGFLLARSGDLGGTAVGLIIWSERNLNFSFKKVSKGTVSIESSDLPACRALASFALSEKGYVLRDGNVVAQAH